MKRVRAAALVVLSAWAGAGEAATPTPTPGPAARAGGAIDQAWSSIQEEVTAALLITKIRVALLQNLKDDGLNVSIQVKGDTAELSGQVRTRANQELARQVALSVRGVRQVHNRITVAPPSAGGEPPVSGVVEKVERHVADAILEAKVKSGLIEQLGTVAFDIEVEAVDGVVSLSGTVPDRAREELAVGIARSTKGVKELHDLLHVKQ